MRGRQVTFRWVPQSRFALPLQMLVMALLVCALWATHVAVPQDRTWVGYTYLLFFPAWMMALNAPGLRLLADGALVSVSLVGAPQSIPLGTAELTCRGDWWQLRWQRGRTWSRTRLRADPALPLEAAILEARDRAAEGLPVPRTEQEAARAVPVGRLRAPKMVPVIWAVSAGLLVFLGLALWLNQPLFLLAATITPMLLRHARRAPCAVLTRSGLWISAPGSLPVWIAPASVTYVTEVGRGVSVFRTNHPEYPELHLNSFQSAGLVRVLRFGPEPIPVHQATAHQAPSQQTVPACALCGRHAAGSEPAPVPGETYICQECSLRARKEALDAGHGPQGREPRPM